MSFFAELKRRNVFKVAVAYAIVAWLLIQIASILFPTFHAPEWVMQVFTVVIILGFPVAMILAWAYELTPEGIKTASPEGPAQYHTRTTGQRLNYFIIGMLVLAVTFILVDNYILVGESGKTTVSSVAGSATPATTRETEMARRKTAPASTVTSSNGPVRRAYLGLGQAQGIPPVGVKAFIALSRDGKHLVYVVNEGGTAQLHHRQLNQLTSHLIPTGSEATNVCLSPDGEWIGFTSIPSSISKVKLLGGTPQQLAASINGFSGCFWSEKNLIYFTKNNKLYHIPAGGGEPEAVNITSGYSKWTQAWPFGLPDGKHLLLTVTQGNANAGHTALLSLDTGETRILIQNAYNARYVPTGHIVFIRSGSLWAVPFDIQQLKTTGPEVPIIDGVETHINTGIAGYTFSDDGLLFYLPGDKITGVMGTTAQLVGLVWVDREGKEARIAELQLTKNFVAPRLSPDGKQVAVGVPGQSGTDIWTYNFNRGTFSPRTFTGNAAYAIWTPDGQRLIYGEFNKFGLYWTKADGSGQPEQLIKSTVLSVPYSISPDGSRLVFVKFTSSNNPDIYVLSMTDERAPQPLIATEFGETQPAISPDGHWIAYSSTESGQLAVYVRPFPDTDNGKWRISTDGGMDPRWRNDGKELFYTPVQFGEGKANVKGIKAVDIDTETGFRAGKPKAIFTGDYAIGDGWSFDVNADGQRFLMLKSIKVSSDDIKSQLTNLVMVDNWFEELKQLVPPAK